MILLRIILKDYTMVKRTISNYVKIENPNDFGSLVHKSPNKEPLCMLIWIQ